MSNGKSRSCGRHCTAHLPCISALSNIVFLRIAMTPVTLLFCKLMRRRKRRDAQKWSFRQRGSFLLRRRRDLRVLRIALQMPRMSAFEFLYGSGCEQSLITLTGFDHRSFKYMLELFRPLYTSHTPCSEDGMIRKLPYA